MASGSQKDINTPIIVSSLAQLKGETVKHRAPVLESFYPTDSQFFMDMYGASAVGEGLSMYHNATILDTLLWGVGRMMAIRHNPSTNEMTYRNTWFSNKNLFKVVNCTYSYTIASKGYLNITTTNLGLTAQTGYEPIGINSINVDASNKGVVLMGVNLTDLSAGKTAVVVRNTKDVSVTSGVALSVIFMRDVNV